MSFVYDKPQSQDWSKLSDAQFRALIRADFEKHYPAELRFSSRRLRWSETQDWFRHIKDNGWVAPNWPVEFGGMGLSPAKLLIFMEEQERWGIARYPDQGVIMVGPVLMRYGTEEQRRKYLPKILAGENIWCQGYSEPNAGSDLASLSSYARIEGDHFIFNGQKIWTTLAQDASHMFLLARTDKEAKKQEGISFLLLDFNQPGITIRPIRDMAGHEEFCEVFFDNVKIPLADLVGKLNQGWSVAKSLLGFERIFIGSPKMPQYALRVLTGVARARGVLTDAAFRDKFAQLRLDVAHLAALYERFAGMVTRGEPLGADVSMLKIIASETAQRITDLIVDVAGDSGGMSGDTVIGAQTMNVLAPFYRSRPTTIYGGSNEIQRNILARQVLNLPA